MTIKKYSANRRRNKMTTNVGSHSVFSSCSHVGRVEDLFHVFIGPVSNEVMYREAGLYIQVLTLQFGPPISSF